MRANRIQPLRRAITFLSSEKFNWNETYIATTTAGHLTRLASELDPMEPAQ